jgi:hypothetical protein
MKLQKSDKIAVLMFCLIIQISCLWCIDVSTTGMIDKILTDAYKAFNPSVAIKEGVMTNGFFKSDPFIMYHLSLYGLILSTFLLALMCVHTLIKDKPGE